MAQVSGDVSVSAQVGQTGQQLTDQGGIVPPFFLESGSRTQIESLKEAKLIFSGKTSPGAFVLIKLIQAAAEVGVFANSKGDFYVERRTLFNNYYDIIIQAADVFNKKSSAYTFTFNIIPGENKKENIFLPPTMALEKSEIAKGDIVNIKGATYPLSSVIINISSFDGLNSRQLFSNSNDLGLWNAEIKTTDFSSGTYFISVFAQTQDGSISAQSDSLILRILKKEVPVRETPTAKPPISLPTLDVGTISQPIKKADLSQDQKVGVKDLSVLLANWGGNFRNPAADLNNDKKVDLKDLSILMFYWTR